MIHSLAIVTYRDLAHFSPGVLFLGICRCFDGYDFNQVGVGFHRIVDEFCKGVIRVFVPTGTHRLDG